MKLFAIGAIVVVVYSAIGYGLAALFESAGCFIVWFGWPILLPMWAYQWCRERLRRLKDKRL